MDPSIVIRDTRTCGDRLTVPQAIARLCGGGPVTVTLIDPAPRDGGPRHESGITIYPADDTCRPERPPEIAWGGARSWAPASAVLFAGALALASDLAAYAAVGQAAAGQAAAIGAVHSRDAARRELGAAAPRTCEVLISRLNAGDPLADGMFRPPALGGEYDIDYFPGDLGADLGLSPGDAAMTEAQNAYRAQARTAFWDEALRIARDRAASHPLMAWEHEDEGPSGDHLPDCETFTDYDGSTGCSCGGFPCESGFSIGPAYDPYSVTCEYIQRDHPVRGGCQIHRGVNPLPGPGPEPQYVEWVGGGYCAGDPLPVRDVVYLAAGGGSATSRCEMSS